MQNYLFTSESVTEGHPDKLCDQVSDAVLDAIVAKDPQARVACEVSAAPGMLLVMGEVAMKKNYKLCGCLLVWENPSISGHFHSNSGDMESWPICHDCMIEHCCNTNCLACQYGSYPECRFLEIKRHYMSE